MTGSGSEQFFSPPLGEGAGEGERAAGARPPHRRRTPPPNLPLKGEEPRSGAPVRIAGYAALFGISDAARDTILPGAFAATLAGRGAPLPLYWQHRPGQRIGWVESAREDARGLRVIARLDPGTRPAALLGEGAVSGLSFGYRARDFRITPNGRELAAVELFEGSLVTHPLQQGARVHWTEPTNTSSPGLDPGWCLLPAQRPKKSAGPDQVRADDE